MQRTVEQWGMFELKMPGPGEGNPFRDVGVKAVFSYGHRDVEVDGFYAGNGEYRVRFMPDTPGEWRYRTVSSAGAMNDLTGDFQCVMPGSGNHGPVYVDDIHHFRYADGTFYNCIGTTCYGWIHQTEEHARQTLETLAGSPFNKIRMTIFPKSYEYCETEPAHYLFPLIRKGSSVWNGHWEGKGGTIEWRFDLDRFDTAFFDMLDDRIRALMALGIQADIILFHPYDRWGFAQMEEETDLFYLRYLVARIAAFRNVWWSLANEWSYMKHKLSTAYWEKVAETIRSCDPCHRLTGIHNGPVWYDQNRPWITHATIQSSACDMHKTREDFNKPLVFDEIGYEGDVKEGWGNLPARELVHRFWQIAVQGGYPGHSEVYYNDEWRMWWNTGGVMRGESPPRIAFLREIMESGPDKGIRCAPSSMCAFCMLGLKDDGWIIGYTGISQPREVELNLPSGRRYALCIIDTWNMTRTAHPSVIECGGVPVVIALPARPYTAFLLTRER